MAGKKPNQVGYERTFVMIKPDGTQRGLIGEIFGRFEKRGLKITALKMIKPSFDLVDNHYPSDEAWIERLGEKGFKVFEECGVDIKENMGTDDKKECGKLVRKWLLEYIMEAPVVAAVIEGYHAVELVRKMVGVTAPSKAELGTIRGDFSLDSPVAANLNKRAMKNLIHASETPDEAAVEITHWFSEDEIFDYNRTDHAAMF